MLPTIYVPVLLAALLVTVLELTEVVALVFALSADAESIRHGALGAVAGCAVVAGLALGSGAALLALPHDILLWASAAVLYAFGVFLFRSTRRTYRRLRAAQLAASPPGPPPHRAVQFAGGFTVGAVESTEVVVVLLALTAAGYGGSAIVGAVVGAVLLVAATFAVGERVRRIKVPWLKLGATSVVFAFAVFWTGEALGRSWPGSDLFLIPLVLLAGLLVRGVIGLELRRRPPVPVVKT